MSTKISGGAAIRKTKRVFLRTGTAYEGFALNYNWDAMGVTAENEAFTTIYGRSFGTAIESWNDARRLMVEAPSEDNNLHFAGVVSHESNGVVGPNWVAVDVPGSVCKIYASLSAAHAVDTHTRSYPGGPIVTSRNHGGLLTFNVATGTAIDGGEFKYSGFPGEGSAITLQVASAADQLIMAELMTGPPSGGVQVCPFGTGTDYSAGVTIMMGGVTLITAATLAASGLASAALSAGGWPGMKKRIASTAHSSNLSLVISCHVPVMVPFTTGPAVLGAKVFVSGDKIALGDISNPDFTWIDMEWNGGTWVVLSNGAGVLVT